MLKDFYYQDDRREESARLMLDEADKATVNKDRFSSRGEEMKAKKEKASD